MNLAIRRAIVVLVMTSSLIISCNAPSDSDADLATQVAAGISATQSMNAEVETRVAATLTAAVPPIPGVQASTDVQTAEPKTVNIDLKSELFFDGGAEQGSMVPLCQSLLFEEYNIPYETQVEFVSNNVIPSQLKGTGTSPFFLVTGVSFGDLADLCVYGFPEDESITITLYTPEGQRLGVKTLDVSEYYYLSIGDITVVHIPMYWPRILSPGQWYLAVESASAEGEGPLEIQWMHTGISVLSEARVDPLNDQRPDSVGECYFDDQEILVAGNGYDPNTRRPLGIYYSPTMSFDEGYDLVYSEWITVDDQGFFSTVVPVDSSTPNGHYCIVAPIERMPESQEQDGFIVRDYHFFVSPEIECYKVCR